EKYEESGESKSLGCAISPVTIRPASFQKTKGYYQVVSEGSIEYYDAVGDSEPNGDPLGQAFVVSGPFYDRWSQPICDGTFQVVDGCPDSTFARGALGYPTSDVSSKTKSHHETMHRFQDFEGGSLIQHISGSQQGLLVEIHGAIFAKWTALGSRQHHLGLPTTDEREA